MEEDKLIQAKQGQERLWDILIGFIASQVLYACVELGLFPQLSGRTLTLAEVAESLGVDPRPVERLLTAAAALGLVEREGERYHNSELAELCLVPGRAGYFGHMVSYYINNHYPSTGQLVEMVRSGEPVPSYWLSFPTQEEAARHSTLAMENQSYLIGHTLASAVDLSGAKRLMDVGGGSGALAKVLAESYPQLEAVVLDQAPTLAAAQALWAGSPAQPRLKPHPANFLEEELPAGFDVALVSNIIHGYGAGTCRQLMGKVFEALNPGGIIVVIDFYLHDDQPGPVFSALFGVGAALRGKGARTYTRGEVRAWLEAAGFGDIRHGPLNRQASFVSGRKP